jgi:acyl-ACP thioesterase
VSAEGPRAVQGRTERFEVHTYEVDAFQKLAVPALAGFLQEVAGHHASEMGCGFEAMKARGLAWVLLRQRVEVAHPIALGEVLEVTTWPSGVDRLAALREFVVRRRDGAEVARATTQWIVMDLERRRPVRPDRVLEPAHREPREHVLPAPEPELPVPSSWEAERRFSIRYQDIDMVLHVNNTSYAGWAIEALPRETWQSHRLASLEAHFLAECQYGSTVISRLSGSGPFLHGIFREEDGRELARLRTSWVARGP